MPPIPAHATAELTFIARTPHADPFNTVTLDAVFCDPAGRALRVPAFWAGGDTWKIRYASPLPGRHTYRTECSDPGDGGLHDQTGTVEIGPATGNNPLLRHGPVQVAPGRRHLQHADGTPFFWLGDTWWMGLCQRFPLADFQRLAADRQAKGFNLVQIVAGLYPDMPAFDPRGANETGFPWTEDYGTIRPEYFDAAEIKLRHLVACGLMPCLVGAWGYFMPWMGVEKLQRHWRYLIARFGAWPITWCIAGEANLPWYLAPGFPYDDRTQAAGWTEVMRYVRATDPFRRPLTIHPTAINRYTARHATVDPALLDFDLLQTPHAQNEGVPIAIRAVRESHADPLTLPVINGEPCYEMLGDTLTSAWPRRAFWSCLLNGACGHTYGANGIWQCNQPGQPHGNSPWGGGYGSLTWEQAMHLPGSSSVSLGKKLLTAYPWTRFNPHPEWATFADLKWLDLSGGQWIWPDAATPPADAPNRRAYFRRTFTLPPHRPVARAHLRIAGMNHIETRLNGIATGTGWNRQTGAQFDDLARHLRPGDNVLTIWVEHRPATKEPAGLLAVLEITFADGESLRLVSDAAWKCTDQETPGWLEPAFNDRAWAAPVMLGRLGDAPWGGIDEPDPDLFGPQSAGIPGLVRVHYMPCALPVVIRHLGAGTRYRVQYFDPLTGTRTALGTIKADPNGQWTCPPPDGMDHDWVLVLEAQHDA